MTPLQLQCLVGARLQEIEQSPLGDEVRLLFDNGWALSVRACIDKTMTAYCLECDEEYEFCHDEIGELKLELWGNPPCA